MRIVSRPKLTQDELRTYADRYSYGREDQVISMVPTVRQRGFMTKPELITLGDWKSPRIRSKIASNDESVVEVVSRMSLEARDVKLAVHIPQALVGVGMPVASTFLHWFHEEPFPILDFRALWTLGIDMPNVYSLAFWESYVDVVRALASDWKTDMRTLDRALWQYSSENQNEN